LFGHDVITNHLLKRLGEEAKKDVERILQMKLEMEEYRWLQGHRKGLEDAGMLVEKGIKVLFEGEQGNGTRKGEGNERDNSSLF
jgi:hypothetical protein